MTNKEIIEKNLSKFIQDLRTELDLTRSQGRKINNTNKANESLHYKSIDNSNFQVLGLEYLEFLDKGRGEGKFPNLGAIKEWVRTKLGITNEKEIKQVAFLVGRKIAEEGTEIYKDNSKGIALTKNVEKLADNLTKDLAKNVVFGITEQLDKFAKKRLQK